MKFEDLPPSLFHQQHRCIFKQPRFRGAFSRSELKVFDEIHNIAWPYLVVDWQSDCYCETEDYDYDSNEPILIGYNDKFWRLDGKFDRLSCPTITHLTVDFVRNFLSLAFSLAGQEFAPNFVYQKVKDLKHLNLDPAFDYFYLEPEFTGIVGCNLAGGFCWAMMRSFVKTPK